MSKVNIKIKQFRKEVMSNGLYLPIPKGADKRHTRKLEPGEVVEVDAAFAADPRVAEVAEVTTSPATRPTVFPDAYIAKFSSPNAPKNTEEQRDWCVKGSAFLQKWAEDNKPRPRAQTAKEE